MAAIQEGMLARLRAGDEATFVELVRRETPRLLATARRLLRDEEDARDAVQETFLAAGRSIADFQGEALLSTWLHRIVVNCALMRLRSRRRRPEESLEAWLPRFDEAGRHSEAVISRATAEDLLLRRDLRRTVRAAIDRLPESYRTVLLLRDIEDFDTEEVAEALGVTANAVKVRLHRARQALRALLDESQIG